MRSKPDDHDHINAGWEEPGVPAERLAQEALGAVSFHRAADLAGRDDAKPRRADISPGGEQEQEVTRVDARRAVLNTDEVGAFADA